MEGLLKPFGSLRTLDGSFWKDSEGALETDWENRRRRTPSRSEGRPGGHSPGSAGLDWPGLAMRRRVGLGLADAGALRR
jgi:hypothetical protein